MAGPWEKYAGQSSEAEPEGNAVGPWTAYQDETLTDVFGSVEAAQHAMTGDVVQPEITDGSDHFLNPYTGQMTNRDMLRENIQRDLTRKQSVPTMAAHGATLGTSDEAVWLGAGANALVNDLPHGTPADAARFEQEQHRARLEASRGKFPYSSFAAEMVGGFVVPGGQMTDAKKAQGWGQAMKHGAKVGGITGGLYALGEGEGVSGRLRDIPAGVGIGATGGALAVPVTKAVLWAGSKVSKPLARLFADRRYYNEAAGITPAGREAMEALGYNADEVSEAFTREFGQNIDAGIDPKTAAVAAEMAEFDIPAYKHNVTGSAVDAADFERARRGGAGSAAEARVGRAASEQFDASRKAVDDVATRYGGGVSGDKMDAATAVAGRIDDIKTTERAASQAAYEASEAAGLRVDPDVASGVYDRIATRLAQEEIALDSGVYAKSKAFMNILKKRGSGTEPVSLKAIDTYRKNLNRIMGSADEMDKGALTIIKNEYDAWIDDVVEAKLFSGDADGLDELKAARGLWSEYARKFRGKDAGSKFLQKIVDRDASPEQVMKWMFGSSSIETSSMNSKMAATLKSVLGEGSDEWNLLRQAAFRQLTQKPGTEVVSEGAGVIPWGPQKVSQNLFKFLDSPATRPLAGQLFTKAEKAEMRRLATAISRMVPPPGAVNTSNTSYELSRMGQKAFEALSGAIGLGAGGPAGGIASREGARAVGGAKSWLAGVKLASKYKGPMGVGAPAVGGIAGGQIADPATNLLFPDQQERAYPR